MDDCATAARAVYKKQHRRKDQTKAEFFFAAPVPKVNNADFLNGLTNRRAQKAARMPELQRDHLASATNRLQNALVVKRALIWEEFFTNAPIHRTVVTFNGPTKSHGRGGHHVLVAPKVFP